MTATSKAELIFMFPRMHPFTLDAALSRDKYTLDMSLPICPVPHRRKSEILSVRHRLFNAYICERVVHRHGTILLIVRVRTGFNPRRIRHCGSWCARQRTNRQWWESRSARERKKTKREQTTHTQTCDIMDDMQMEWMRNKDTWATMWSVHKVKMFETNSRVKCICLHHPSVTTDRYRL